jgi:aspartyl/asparaginyl-tRNA synthetase
MSDTVSSSVLSVPRINPKHYAYVVKKLRSYCDEQGLTECYLNDIPTTLSSCEDPTNLHTYSWDGVDYALPQTSQMLLETVILKDGPESKGFYNICNSFRLEKNPVKNRHQNQFPLFEIEGPWDMNQMIQFQKGLLLTLGIKPWGDDFPEIDYLDACAKYNVTELDHQHEIQLCRDLNSPAVFLKRFALTTSPFWNMLVDGNVAKKVDVLIGNPCGGQPMEVFGSSERSCNPEEMREMFHTVSDGQYAEYLYQAFGKERIEKELEEYLSNTFFKRAGMGIGISRLCFACETLGIFDLL